jgi:hypothetical protein
MSRLSKIFLIASPVSFFLASVIHQSRLWNLESQLDGASEEWASVLVHLYATGWDIWDDITVYLILAGFACFFCAILVWERDRPHQKLFPE